MPKYKYLIENSNNSCGDALIITLKPKTPQDIFNFKPGQYVMLSFTDTSGKLFINHPFSIASSPTEDNLVFGIRVMGKFTQTLCKLPQGTEIDILGPFGIFVFDETKYSEAVFIAGGVGITPFISAIKYATAKGLNNKLTLLYSNRGVKETLFYDDIKQLITANPNFSAQIAITNETVSDDALYCKNCYIDKNFITSSVDSVINKDFFLCGPNAFMKAMEKNLIDLGINKNRIHQESFSVTPDTSLKSNYLNILLVYGFSIILFIVALIFVSGGFKEEENEGNTEIDYQIVNTNAQKVETVTATITPTITPTYTPASTSIPAPRTRTS